MKISKIKFYGGSRDKVCRLGLAHIFLELQELLIATDVRVEKKKQGNGAGQVRELIDASFANYPGWVQARTGDIDWKKRLVYNQTVIARMGVEIQVSGRSDLLARDIVHIRNNLQDSNIDAGVIVIPSDDFEYYLTDRVANYSYAVKYVEEELREAQSYPIVLIAVEHDGFSEMPLPKKTTNRGKGKRGGKIEPKGPPDEDATPPD